MRPSPFWLKGLMFLLGIISLIGGSFCSVDVPLLFCIFPGSVLYGIWQWKGEKKDEKISGKRCVDNG